MTNLIQSARVFWRKVTRRRMNKEQLRRLGKLNIHEHLDCSVRHYTILDLMAADGCYPESMPARVLELWRGDHVDKELSGRELETALHNSRREAAAVYGEWISTFARQSLKNYLDAIVNHILPVMQTSENLYRITKERIEDATKDGTIAMELRFAPQLHTKSATRPLNLDEVMEAVIRAIQESPFPLKLCICALRHENGATARELADLAIKHRDFVGVFDLAADETAFPGVLDWWLPEALRARRDGGCKLTCHLWETNEPTADDLRKLAEHGIDRLGHGVRGDEQGERTIECCPTSNVVTGQYKSIAKHPIDRHFRKKRRVTVNTDGLTFCFSVPEGLSEEYFNLQETFGWGSQEFYAVNVNAVMASAFDQSVKESLLEQLRACYLSR